MTQKNAQIIFVIFNVLAGFAVSYVIYDFVAVNNAIRSKGKIIPFDTGTYYYLLGTVFWVLSIIQYVGLNNKETKLLKYSNFILVIWFILMLFLANIIPYYLSNKMEDAGYEKCDDPGEISRVAKGESNFYKLSGCK